MFMLDDVEEIRRKLVVFRDRRNWKQFHDPKNLAEAISIEASELLEIFLWKTIDESRNLSENEIEYVKNEVADIFIYLIYICQELDIDLLVSTEQKIILNKEKYPVREAKGPNKS
jgi:NTP pyrophosphatase (non-canonical NTP hydrolase)